MKEYVVPQDVTIYRLQEGPATAFKTLEQIYPAESYESFPRPREILDVLFLR